MCSVRNPQCAGIGSIFRAHDASIGIFLAIAALLLISASPTHVSAQEAEQEVGASASNEFGGSDTDSATEGAAAKTGALTLEGMILTRSDQPHVPFTASGFNPNTGSGAFRNYTYISTEDFGNEVTSGVRGTLRGEMFGQMVEFSAFGMTPMELEFSRLTGQLNASNNSSANGMNTNASYHSENYAGTDSGLNSANSENIYAVMGRLQTKLAGAEANVVEPLGVPGLMVGARAIYFGEELGVAVMKNIDAMPDRSGNARDRPFVRTDNYLIGVQAGLQGMFDLGGGLSVGGNVKAGIFDNEVVRRRAFFSENQSVRNMDITDRDRDVAWGVDVNPRVNLQLSDNAFLTVAGTFLWLGNVSQAVDHFVAVADRDDNDLRANRDVYFYGGSLGLTFLLDNMSSGSGPSYIDMEDFPAGAGGSIEDVDERVVELEETTTRRGNSKVTVEVSGWVNRMVMAWDDGHKQDAYIVDNVASRSRIELNGYAKIARGWSAGYYLGLGIDDQASNDLDQLNAQGEDQIELRHSMWWVRNNMLGTINVGHGSTATDNVILNDVGGIMPGAANISTIGGGLLVRHADEPDHDDEALITTPYTTTLDDFAAGASVDTLRRDVIRYDTPRFDVLGGKLDFSAAWGEDDFYDVSAWYRINWNDWRFRSAIGYLHDKTTPVGRTTSNRDREEIKGSASLLHVPSGLFGTAAYMHRTFNGYDPSKQAVFGENTAGKITPPGANRPPIDYFYAAAGIRRGFSSIGETSVYGEFAQVTDAIAGLEEAGFPAGSGEVDESRLTMFGAAICQDLDWAAMDLYAGFRIFQFDTHGIRTFSGNQRWIAEPLSDISIAYTGARIKF